MASAHRMERLKAEAEKQKQSTESSKVHHHAEDAPRNAGMPSTHAGAPLSAFSPMAASSPRANGGSILPGGSRAKSALRNVSTGMVSIGPDAASFHRPPSPILSDAGSTVSLPDELVRYRQHPYMAPEKLQIVKPLEGSMTLLKWKLLATPQLGGATTFFSDASLPGVHKKAGQTLDESSFDLRQKSASTLDLSSTSPGHYSTGSLKRRHSKRDKERERGIRTKAGGDLGVSVGTESGMNAMAELLPQDTQSTSLTGSPGTGGSRVTSPGPRRPAVDQERGRGRATGLQPTGGREEGESPSFLRQVGNLLGLSRFSRQVEPQPVQGGDEQRGEGERGSHTTSRDTGLAGLL